MRPRMVNRRKVVPPIAIIPTGPCECPLESFGALSRDRCFQSESFAASGRERLRSGVRAEVIGWQRLVWAQNSFNSLMSASFCVLSKIGFSGP